MTLVRSFVRRAIAVVGKEPGDEKARASLRPALLAGIALLAAFSHHALVSAAGPEPRQTLPDLTFQTAQNESIALQDLKGRVVFVGFWATNCKACATMRAAAERLYKHAAGDTWFMGVNEDAQRQTWKDYMQHHFSALSEVWDEGHSLRRTMGVAGQPAAFLVGRSGRVRWRCARWTAATEAEASALLGNLERETSPQ
jgi:peroxiredoxin